MGLGLCCWLAATCALAFAAGGDTGAGCRPEYVVPYNEQCEFQYKNLKTKAAPGDLSQAFDACARAQDAALPCTQNAPHDVHVVAMSALYRAVTLQADIAMYARQFVVAEALLREKLGVLDLAAHEARPGDATVAKERDATQRDLAQARAGACTERAVASAGRQHSLAKSHDYGGLATLLRKKYDDYTSCAKLATQPVDRAYVEYVGLVALEESGRAAQAGGRRDDATHAYSDCIDGAQRSARYANARVKGYLVTVAALCRGRRDGTYRVDQPQPIDADDGRSFKPLTLPDQPAGKAPAAAAPGSSS